MNEKPLTPCVIALESGKITAAHCNCAAGIVETHVALLLWVIGIGVESRDSLTITQKSAHWVMPPTIRSVPYAPLKDIDFIGNKRKSCTNLEQLPVVPHQRNLFPKHQRVNRCSFSMPWLRVQELSLAVTPGYSDACIPAYFTPELPMVLSDLSSQITLV